MTSIITFWALKSYKLFSQKVGDGGRMRRREEKRESDETFFNGREKKLLMVHLQTYIHIY